MGERGPVAKRSNQVHGHRADGWDEGVTKLAVSGPVTIPEPDPEWHPVALAWYQSLEESGQSRFYESSDWAVALILAESISRDLKPQVVGITEDGKVVRDTIPLKGASLAAYLKGFSSLMATEGDRRRMRLELTRQEATDDDEKASVSYIGDLRERFGSA